MNYISREKLHSREIAISNYVKSLLFCFARRSCQKDGADFCRNLPLELNYKRFPVVTSDIVAEPHSIHLLSCLHRESFIPPRPKEDNILGVEIS